MSFSKLYKVALRGARILDSEDVFVVADSVSLAEFEAESFMRLRRPGWQRPRVESIALVADPFVSTPSPTLLFAPPTDDDMEAE